MKSLIIIFISFCLFLSINTFGQMRGTVWCFGDSAGIDFSIPANPTPINTSLVTRGTCVSVADTSGELLFYANTRSAAGGIITGRIWNHNHILLDNGDSISGGGWYQEMIIIPQPGNDSLYYLFSIGVTMLNGLKYSIINMNSNGGLGEVVQKNIPLFSGMLYVDCINAVKHGNGRDWWIMVRESPIPGGINNNNSWYLFLISPAGISQVPIQYVGSINATNSGRLSVNPEGNKIAFINSISMVELYDFDRCTGLISNPVNIEMQSLLTPYPTYWSCEFSSNGRYLYVSSQSTTNINYLWQYDTWSTNIFSTKTLIWQAPSPPSFIGALKRGPDNKIYVSTSWCSPNGASNYPYDSTMYYLENMNLSVINSPDSAGAACDFQPWSFYLGGKRSYLGLPNNPDYDMPALAGSPCDTLVSINEPASISTNANLHVYYAPDWEKAFINADKLKGKHYRLRMVDVLGKEVYSEIGMLNSQYFTRDLNCASFASGIYILVLETEQVKLTKKFVIE